MIKKGRVMNSMIGKKKLYTVLPLTLAIEK